MACLAITGITASQCSDSEFGGLANPRIWLGNRENFVWKYATGNTTTLTIGTATGCTVSNADKFWAFDTVQETSSYDQKLTYTDYSNYILQTLAGSITNITQAKKQVFEKLRFARLCAIVQTDDDQYELLGDSGQGLKQAVGELGTGKKHTDPKGMNFAFECASKTYARDITKALVTTLVDKL